MDAGEAATMTEIAGTTAVTDDNCERETSIASLKLTVSKAANPFMRTDGLSSCVVVSLPARGQST